MEKETDKKEGLSSEHDLRTLAEDFYLWLMRSSVDLKARSQTFQVLSQIMRIAQSSESGGNYLPKSLEKEAYLALSNIKEQVQDGKIQLQNLLEPVCRVLQKLTHENPKAQLIAHATEIEYIFCIHPKYQSFSEPDYRQKFKGYLKILIDTVSSSFSSTQARAIAQILSQVVKNPERYSKDPQKNLTESLQKSGIVILDVSRSDESKTA